MTAPEIVRTYTEALPALRLVGRRYTEADLVDGSYAAVWAA
ncbi:hypothetical protein [Xylanimonas protaetiae]|nr:hypothetical protein [Xylanimonas protaetiae]